MGRKQFTFEGVDTYIAYLKEINADTVDMIGKAIHEGAKVGANEMSSKINKIPIGSGFSAITQDMVDGLKESFGITKMSEDSKGFYNVKLGFDGYNKRIPYRPDKTGKWVKDEQGMPNQYIANIIEKGNSYHAPYKFSKLNAKAIETAMKDTFDTEIKKIK